MAVGAFYGPYRLPRPRVFMVRQTGEEEAMEEAAEATTTLHPALAVIPLSPSLPAKHHVSAPPPGTCMLLSVSLRAEQVAARPHQPAWVQQASR